MVSAAQVWLLLPVCSFAAKGLIGFFFLSYSSTPLKLIVASPSCLLQYVATQSLILFPIWSSTVLDFAHPSCLLPASFNLLLPLFFSCPSFFFTELFHGPALPYDFFSHSFLLFRCPRLDLSFLLAAAQDYNFFSFLLFRFPRLTFLFLHALPLPKSLLFFPFCSSAAQDLTFLFYLLLCCPRLYFFPFGSSAPKADFSFPTCSSAAQEFDLSSFSTCCSAVQDIIFPPFCSSAPKTDFSFPT
jgi:hypothetical protein